MEERVFVINLRRDRLKTSTVRNSEKAISTIREHLKRHMKIGNVRIGDSINREVWSKGSRKTTGKVKIKAILTKDADDKDIVKAEMWGHVFEEELIEEPKKEKKQEKTEAKEQPKPEETPKEPESADK